MYDEDFIFLETSLVWEFDGVYGFGTIHVYILCKSLDIYVNLPSINMVSTQVITWEDKFFAWRTHQISMFDWYCKFDTHG